MHWKNRPKQTDGVKCGNINGRMIIIRYVLTNK